MGVIKQLGVAAAAMIIVLLQLCHACWEGERIALLQLNDTFNFLSSGRLNANCCDWNGVICDADTKRVIEIDLWFVRYSSELDNLYLNASLFLPFRELKVLYLSGNNIIGCMKNEGFEKLAGLSNLEFLDLSGNNFNNNVLSSLSALPSLKSLNVSNNELKGMINIDELNKLASLKELVIDGNEIEGFISSNGVANLELSSLEILSMKDNKLLNESIFSYLGGLSSLKYLDLSFNQLRGLFNVKGDAKLELSNLETLYLTQNKLNESIVSYLGGLPSLKFLFLGYNQLRGSFNVKELNGLKNLEWLDLSGNQITNFVASKDNGTLPNLHTLWLYRIIGRAYPLLQSLGAFPYLKIVYLRSNNLTKSTYDNGLHNHFNIEELYLDGSIVDENILAGVDAFPSLKSLSLFGCGLSGPLSPAQGLCNLTRLQYLDMTYNDLNGTLPGCLANLTSLQTLDLSFNLFTENIFLFPLNKLTSLQHLDLSSNFLRGNIPFLALSKLTSLQFLDLSNNSFSGDLLSCSFGELTSLKYIGLASNHLRIPVSLVPFYNCSKLKKLNVVGNDLYSEIEVHDLIPKFQLEELHLACDGCGGIFPKFLYYQNNLHLVDLSNNNMTGEFPNWLLNNNTQLGSLDLANNSLSGYIQMPTHFHSNLKYLDTSSNHLHGQIPIEMGAIFPSLISLNLSNNNFNGGIPLSFSNLSWLVTLDLSSNNFFGNIPDSLTSGCFFLETLVLSNNSFQGQILSEKANLKWLSHLHANGNQFTGSIPQSLSRSVWLELLDLNDNDLSGQIPSWLGNMEYLLILDLSKNNFSGKIPFFNGSPILREVYMSRNNLHGGLEKSFSNNSKLMILDLSNNFLTGSIPKWIQKLSNLTFFHLGHNSFDGEIPIQLCNLIQLSLIDLSNNNFSGHIPSCLSCRSLDASYRDLFPFQFLFNGSLSSSHQQSLEITTKSLPLFYQGRVLSLLSGIDLSCNNLTGQIPSEIGNLTDIHFLNLSYNGLSGTIPTTFSHLAQIESLDLSNNKLEGQIPTQLEQLNFLSTFVVAHNNLSGSIPEGSGQFPTFAEKSYEGNPFLCGKPLPNSCTPAVPPSPMPVFDNEEEEDDGFMDMEVFYVSFAVTYIIVLLGIAVVLYINPYWRRAWFYFLETIITTCYDFVVDNYPTSFIF